MALAKWIAASGDENGLINTCELRFAYAYVTPYAIIHDILTKDNTMALAKRIAPLGS